VLTTVEVKCNDSTAVTLAIGATAKCSAVAKDQNGATLSASFQWSSEPTSVATVEQTGDVTAQDAGTATISATATYKSANKTGSATVTVKAPTLHTNPITASETWRAADNPHVVRGNIVVSDATTPTLTLEAGVVIRFEQDAELRVTNGVLKALGTQAAPIQMVSSQRSPTKGYWRGVVFDATGSASELNYVTLSHCGSSSGDDACIALKTQAAPVLRHVTVQNSGSAGVSVADDGSAFGAESTTLSVSGSEGYAVRIGANQAGTLPAGGTFTGNAPNAVELQGNVTRTQAWPNLGIPYVVQSHLKVEGNTSPVLTLAAGTQLRFGPDTSLTVGSDESGGLIVDGTAAAPVLFTANAAAPSPGHWRGVHLHAATASTSRISHATIEYAGAGGSVGTGNLNLYGNYETVDSLRFKLENVVVQKGSQYGLYMANDAAFAAGSTMLSARDNGSYAVSLEANYVGGFPTGGTFSGNTLNAVEIRGDFVLATQTWPNLGIPYVVQSHLKVEGATEPTLTLAAGTVLRFGPDTSLTVGSDNSGGLVVDGTAAAPVLFTANAAAPSPGHWRGVHLHAATASTSRISHATIEYAGAGGSVGTGNLNLYGNYETVDSLRFKLENVVVQKGSQYGLYMANDAAFAAGSTMLSARDNGNYAISLEANYAGGLPTGGTFSGNTLNAVEIRGGSVVVTQTWPNLGIPYVVNDFVNVGSNSSPTLTLSAGTELRFGADQEFRIGGEVPGTLIADGTAAAPIHFVANAANPTKGHWRGLHFWYAGGSKLNHVRVSHAGAEGSIGTGNVNVYREIGAFVTNTTLSDSAGCGLTRSTGSYSGSTNVTSDFTAAALSNTFTTNTGGTQCAN
jgi:hypothetical protein